MVQLKQVMSRWRSLSLRRSQRGAVACEDDGSRPVPAGSMGIYIGEERRRFIIPTRFLNFRVISSMLNKYEDEMGYTPSGGIILPCSVEFFRLVLRLLDKNEAKYKAFSIDEFLELSGRDGIEDSGAFSCRDDDRCNAFSPLLQRARA